MQLLNREKITISRKHTHTHNLIQDPRTAASALTCYIHPDESILTVTVLALELCERMPYVYNFLEFLDLSIDSHDTNAGNELCSNREKKKEKKHTSSGFTTFTN